MLSYQSLCHHVLSLLSPARFEDVPDLNLGDTGTVRCGSCAATALRGLCSPGLQTPKGRQESSLLLEMWYELGVKLKLNGN